METFYEISLKSCSENLEVQFLAHWVFMKLFI